MKKVITTALFCSFAPTLVAELSWEYTDERARKTKEALNQRSAIEAIAERERERTQQAEAQPQSPAEAKAYAELGQALATHPEMAAVNAAEAKAIKGYQTAVAGGNELEVSLAEQTLSEAKAARYQKALTVPELKQAIIKWQKAKVEAQSQPEDEGKTKAAMDAIQKKIKALGEAMGNE